LALESLKCRKPDFGPIGLVNRVRGTVKSFGARLPKCSAGSFYYKVSDVLPAELGEVLGPVMETIASLTERIKDYNRKIEALAEERYPETELLRQVPGVGVFTALTFVLTLEDPDRFAKSRSVGPYLGLVPSTFTNCLEEAFSEPGYYKRPWSGCTSSPLRA